MKDESCNKVKTFEDLANIIIKKENSSSINDDFKCYLESKMEESGENNNGSIDKDYVAY